MSNNSYSFGNRGAENTGRRTIGVSRSYHQGGGSSPSSSSPASPDITEADLAAVKLGADLKPELYSVTAECIAKLLSSVRGDKNKSTQIRRFYDELVGWSDRVRLAKAEERAEVFASCAPYINMLVARAAYAQGRNLVSPGFEKLVRHLVGQIKDPETLKQAKLFFEAVIGFKKGIEGNK